jgi:DNA-binding NarL/FixJ family response regulator
MKQNEPIRVLLADDHRVFRDGLKALIAEEPDITVAGEAANGKEIVELSGRVRSDVVVMDIAMPDLNGIEATYALKSKEAGPRVLILSMSGDNQSVERALDVEVDGFLVKETAASELLTAIREVARGNAYFSPSVAKILRDLKTGAGREDGPKLSRRERQVLEYVALSKSNKEMSSLMNLSVKTVQKHRQSMMDKLGIHDVAGLTRYAMGKGLIK